MYLTNLAEVVRTAGLTTVESSGWQSRGHGGMSAVRGIICHHTAGSPAGDYPSLAVVRDGHGSLPGPLAQLGLGRSGRVYVIAAGLSYHAGTGRWPGLSGNSDCIGIEAESIGDGSDWTAEQRDAYPRLCAALCRAYGIDPALVIAHREWTPERKIDPTGINMPDLRDAVRVLLDKPGGEGDPNDPIEEDELSAAEVETILTAIRNKPTPELWYGPTIRPGERVNLPILDDNNSVIKQGVVYLHLSWGDNEANDDVLTVYGKQLIEHPNEAAAGVGLFGGVFGQQYGSDTLDMAPRKRYGIQLDSRTQSVLIENRGDQPITPLFTSGTFAPA